MNYSDELSHYHDWQTFRPKNSQPANSCYLRYKLWLTTKLWRKSMLQRSAVESDTSILGRVAGLWLAEVGAMSKVVPTERVFIGRMPIRSQHLVRATEFCEPSLFS